MKKLISLIAFLLLLNSFISVFAQKKLGDLQSDNISKLLEDFAVKDNYDAIVRRINELSKQYHKYKEVYYITSSGFVRSHDTDGDEREFSLSDIDHIEKKYESGHYLVYFWCKGSVNCSKWKGSAWDRNYFGYNCEQNEYGCQLVVDEFNKLKVLLSGGGSPNNNQRERPAAVK